MSLWVFLIVITVILFILFIITVIGYVVQKEKDINGKHCVVIGGSQGIGFEIAKICAYRGAHVTIVARNTQKLKDAKAQIEKHRNNNHQKIEFKSLDVTTNYDKVAKMLSDAEEKCGNIYMLVNCAGLTVCGKVEGIPIKEVRTMIDVNFLGTYFPVRYVLPKMKLAHDGIIVLFGGSSLTSLTGIYGYSVYSSTKFAIRGLAETLAMETKAFGISITLALPPITETPGHAKELQTMPEEAKLITGKGQMKKIVDPQKVASKIVRDALQRSFFSVMGVKSYALACLCVGMATWKGPLLIIIQIVIMGPLRLIGLIAQWYFQKLIKTIPNQTYC